MGKEYNIRIKFQEGQEKPSLEEMIVITKCVSDWIEQDDEEEELKEHNKKIWKYAFEVGKKPFVRAWKKYHPRRS